MKIETPPATVDNVAVPPGSGTAILSALTLSNSPTFAAYLAGVCGYLGLDTPGTPLADLDANNVLLSVLSGYLLLNLPRAGSTATVAYTNTGPETIPAGTVLGGPAYSLDAWNPATFTPDPFGYFAMRGGNDEQTVTVTGATGGTWDYSPDSLAWTVTLAWDADGPTVLAALEPHYGVGNVAVTSPAAGVWVIEATGARAHTLVAPAVVDGAALVDGTIALDHTTEGGPQVMYAVSPVVALIETNLQVQGDVTDAGALFGIDGGPLAPLATMAGDSWGQVQRTRWAILAADDPVDLSAYNAGANPLDIRGDYTTQTVTAWSTAP